ncbi:MAG: TetR/AcrR family transcriptional regulator [Gammaproteobacteria bacterium]|nr:TetR/AcrR family transcriptional regulator [Gammaproteobacteria bacterium]
MSEPQRKTTSVGLEKKQLILKSAENEFDQYSYGGARMQRIADRAGLPKANVHYYFRSKSELYNAVLEDVVGLWNQTFKTLDANHDPRMVLSEFVRMKVEFTRLHPRATRIFTSEMLHGAPHLSEKLNDQMNRWTQNRASVIAQWVESKKIAPIDPYHLIFMIWASTQHFACSEFQIRSVYQKSKLTRKDFADQSASLTTMVLRICGLEP